MRCKQRDLLRVVSENRRGAEKISRGRNPGVLDEADAGKDMMMWRCLELEKWEEALRHGHLLWPPDPGRNPCTHKV
jgi:hypothetical protein